MTKKQRTPQKPKPRSYEARDLILSRRGGKMDKVPSGKTYTRKPKHGDWT